MLTTTPNRIALHFVAVALMLGLAPQALTQPAPERLLLRPELTNARMASLEAPLTFEFFEPAASGPVWNGEGLWRTRPAGLHGLRTVLDATADNDPVWDPGAQAWFAFAYGALVRVDPAGGLPVVLDTLPGHDFDVRAARGLLVYRDPNSDQIVLLRLASGERRVLLSGDFYNPRFSPDGRWVAVSQLKNGGGHLWLVDSETGGARDLGKGYDPAWRPDGRQLLFLRLDDNGHELTAAHLFFYEPASATTRFVATSQRHLVTRPTFSPDGRWIAFVDEQSGQVMASPLPAIGGVR